MELGTWPGSEQLRTENGIKSYDNNNDGNSLKVGSDDNRKENLTSLYLK